MDRFRPLLLNALYPSISRGLTADLHAVSALGGTPYPVCTSIIMAGHGTVTDVLEVPSDAVSAQIEHVLATQAPNAVKIGIVGHAQSLEALFRHLGDDFAGPILFDVTLSGPSGEDIVDQRGVTTIMDHLGMAGLVLIRRQDAELLASMEIRSLDDAQVAVQRLEKRGAQRVVLRCGQLPARFHQEDAPAEPFSVDLYYDGDDFSLFEAPHIEAPSLRGASSALSIALLRELTANKPVISALQRAKAYVTEAIQRSATHGPGRMPAYHDATEVFDRLD